MGEKQAKGDGRSEPAGPTDGSGAETSRAEQETLEPDLDLGSLGAQLRELYGSWQGEPIPERFSKLLDELGEKKSDNS